VDKAMDKLWIKMWKIRQAVKVHQLVKNHNFRSPRALPPKAPKKNLKKLFLSAKKREKEVLEIQNFVVWRQNIHSC